MRAYYKSSPERREYQKEWAKTPKRKASKKVYQQAPKYKSWQKEYYAKKKTETQGEGTLEEFL